VPGGVQNCPTNGTDALNGATTTTHPDQHAGMLVPTGEGVTLVVGNDGGAYAQTVGAGDAFSNAGWGRGRNIGFTTLLPYDAAMAKDGTVAIGLQDNGTAKILKSGKTIGIYDGDGFYVAIDPDDSNIIWEEYTGGAIKVTRDGGKNWTSNNPTMTGALFATPFKMDPTDADHLVIGGREIFETTRGAGTASSTWKKVYDLGTRTQPGKADATAGAGNPVNAESAIDVRGDDIYVGYCGYCDIVTGGIPFGSGIATNVGDGWHIAAAKGLPKRYITSVSIDPKDPKTVYVTLGGYGRRWIPPGSLGDDVSKIGNGHVFMSTNAGASFTDVSGDLPDLPANHVLPYDGKLIVSTDVGVFVSGTTHGGSYHQLGRGLPAVPTFEVSVAPQNSKLLVAATYGRSVWTTTAGDLDRVVSPATPITPVKGQRPGGHLAATGGAPALAALALLLLGGAWVLRRRRS
jgi:MYXO-CTERM domain-containing protein